MSKDYTRAPATRLLATNCVCCGRQLVDACSVELGIGPECRNGIFPEGVVDADRVQANKLVFQASVAACEGKLSEVLELAESIRKMGFESLSQKVAHRFSNAASMADIKIEQEGDKLLVRTPYRRKNSSEFISAWRSIPGRVYDKGRNLNLVPVTSKRELWDLLRKFFPGKIGKGPKGLFKIIPQNI